MRAQELFESDSNRTYWYLSGESYPGHYMGGVGGYKDYIMPANAKSVYTRKDLQPMDFDPQTCVFTNPANGKQYIAYEHDNWDGEDISKLRIVDYPIEPKMRKPFNYPPNDGTPYDANAEYRQKAEAFKPTVLEIWHELQTENWAKIDARIAAYKAKQAAKHPIDKEGVRFNNAAGQTLLAVAKDPNKVFRSDELYFGNGGTMSNAFYKLKGMGYVDLGKSGSYTTVRITPSGIEAANYLRDSIGSQNRKTVSNYWKRNDLLRVPEYLMQMNIPSELKFLESNRGSVMATIEYWLHLIDDLKMDIEKWKKKPDGGSLLQHYQNLLPKRQNELSSLIKHLENGGFKLQITSDLRNRLIKSRIG